MDEALRRRLQRRLPELTLALDCHRGKAPGGIGLGPDGFALITTGFLGRTMVGRVTGVTLVFVWMGAMASFAITRAELEDARRAASAPDRTVEPSVDPSVGPATSTR